MTLEQAIEVLNEIILKFQTSEFLQNSAHAGIIIITGLLAAHFISRLVGLIIKKFGLEIPLKKHGIKNPEYILEHASHNIILVVAFILALHRMGILKTIVSIAGLTLLAVVIILLALNFKDLLSNILSGLVLHGVHHDIKPGIKITSGNISGVVKSFGWTETTLLNTKKEIIIVPNSFLFKNRIAVVSRFK